MKLCSPALVYLVVSFATFVYDVLVMRITANMVLGKSVIVVASTFLLNWLCRGGYAKVAWSILPLPIILFVWTVSIKEGIDEKIEAANDGIQAAEIKMNEATAEHDSATINSRDCKSGKVARKLSETLKMKKISIQKYQRLVKEDQERSEQQRLQEEKATQEAERQAEVKRQEEHKQRVVDKLERNDIDDMKGFLKNKSKHRHWIDIWTIKNWLKFKDELLKKNGAKKNRMGRLERTDDDDFLLSQAVQLALDA